MITRLAPCPSYFAHAGHLRGLLLLSQQASRTPGSKIYLRFDDTGADTYLPQYYRSFLRLFRDYQIPLAGIIKASQRISRYHSVIRKLLKNKLAYLCQCKCNKDQAFRDDCKCVTKNLSWEELCPERVVRLKSCRETDYVILRYVDGKGYLPTLAFQSAVDDKDLSIDTLFRGRDLQSSELRLREIYSKIPGTKTFPKCRYWGLITFYDSQSGEEFPLSKRLKNSEQKMPGLAYLQRVYGRRRLKEFILSYGGTKNNIRLDLKRLRKIKP